MWTHVDVQRDIYEMLHGLFSVVVSRIPITGVREVSEYNSQMHRVVLARFAT